MESSNNVTPLGNTHTGSSGAVNYPYKTAIIKANEGSTSKREAVASCTMYIKPKMMHKGRAEKSHEKGKVRLYCTCEQRGKYIHVVDWGT